MVLPFCLIFLRTQSISLWPLWFHRLFLVYMTLKNIQRIFTCSYHKMEKKKSPFQEACGRVRLAWLGMDGEGPV